jgi:hypothetical protein
MTQLLGPGTEKHDHCGAKPLALGYLGKTSSLFSFIILWHPNDECRIPLHQNLNTQLDYTYRQLYITVLESASLTTNRPFIILSRKHLDIKIQSLNGE